MLNDREGPRVAVIVNDMPQMNIDADLVREGGANLSHTDEMLVEMSNGCIFCTLRDDYLDEMRRLAAEGRFDDLPIESTGISEPLPVAATFAFRDEFGDSLADVVRLDAMVTEANRPRDFSSQDFLRDRSETMGEADERTLVDLPADQMEFADVVALDKVPDAGPVKLDAARAIVRSLDADPTILDTDFAEMLVAAILDTGPFGFDHAHMHLMWAKELHGFADHVPEREEYGVCSYVYRGRWPFDPQAIHHLRDGPLPGVIRAKGHFRLATHPDRVAEFSLTGALSTVKPLGTWWAALPEVRRPDRPQARAYLERHWREPWGDRRQELIFIGAGIDWPALEARLEACLVDDLAEMPDPFPRCHRVEEVAA